MFRYLQNSFTCFLFVIIFSNLSSLHAESTQTPSNEKIVIAQYGKERILLYLPLYIAMEEGLFSKRGLDIDLRFVGNDDQIFATVISGNALFGVGDPVFAAISREKGGPGRIVALLVTKLGFSGYTKNKVLPQIEKVEDLKGLRIGSLPSPSTTYTLLTELIRNNHLEKEGTKIVQSGIGTQLATLEAGQIDIAIDLEPAVSVAESKGYRVNFSLDQFTAPQAITGLSTLDSTIKGKPEIVQKVVSGLQEAMTLFHTHPEISLRVSKKLFPTLTETALQNALKRMTNVKVFPSSVKVQDDYWQRSLKTRLDSGELKKPQATDFTVDNHFADQAIQELEHS